MTIINVRGTNGSGKTTIIRGLMKMATKVEPVGPETRPLSYILTIPGVDAPVAIIGSYVNVNGGCDTIKTQDDICGRVRGHAGLGHHVVFEGVLISVLYQRYADLDKELTADGHKFIWGFLDTPLKVCVARIMDRRAARGDDRPLDTSKSVDPKHRQCDNVRRKAKGAGRDVRVIPYETATTEVRSWL